MSITFSQKLCVLLLGSVLAPTLWAESAAGESATRAHRIGVWGGFAIAQSSAIDQIDQAANQVALDKRKTNKGGFSSGVNYSYQLQNFQIGASLSALAIYDYEYTTPSGIVQLANNLFPIHGFVNYILPFGFHVGLGAGYAIYSISGVANGQNADNSVNGFSWGGEAGYTYSFTDSFSLSLVARYFSFTRTPQSQFFVPSLELAYRF